MINVCSFECKRIKGDSKLDLRVLLEGMAVPSPYDRSVWKKLLSVKNIVGRAGAMPCIARIYFWTKRLRLRVISMRRGASRGVRICLVSQDKIVKNTFPILLLFCQLFIASMAAGDNDTVPLTPMKGVQWTLMEDLKPDSRAANRPIKQKWAVVVGTSKFKEGRLNEGLPMDKAAVNFYDYAIDPTVGKFRKDHVKLLVNDNSTRQNIMAALGKPWLGSLAGPDDLVVVFISTLGFPTTDGQSYLCAYDCALDNIYGTCISIEKLMDVLKQNVKTDRILLVLQACYSGNAELNSGAKSLFKTYNIDVDRVNLGKGYIILSSSLPDQMTWGDAFSNNLVQSLKEENGLVPLKKAFAEAKTKTEEQTLTTSGGKKKQTPVMKADWSGNDLVLGMPPVESVSNIPERVINYLSAEAHYLKANKFVQAGKLDDAKSEYQLAIATDPQYADAYSDYGALLCLQNNWQEAEKQYKEAISLRPDDALFHANYARVLSKLKDDDKSMEELEHAYRLNPKDRIVLCALANKYLQRQNISRAKDLLEEAITLYPRAAMLHVRLSYVLGQDRNFDEAIKEANEAIKLDPSSLSARLNLGANLLLKGDIQSALIAYRQAGKLDPKNPDIHYYLSKALEHSGDLNGARVELEQFLKICSPNDPRLPEEKIHIMELTGQP